MMTDQLRQLGLPANDLVMLHASMRKAVPKLSCMRLVAFAVTPMERAHGS